MPASRVTKKKAWRPHRALLDWYDAHRRELPWRAARREKADPYRTWLSEIMLQQTTVAAVGPYFRTFVARWPNVEALADASLDEVLAAWSGLGYYARARNLHRAAQIVVEDYGGHFPTTAPELAQLPGIGAYTAGAIAAIAFDRREAAIDANAERVIARFFAIREPFPLAKSAIREATVALVPQERPGDFAQALMDLGATTCTPKRPSCGACPWQRACAGYRCRIAESLPVRAAPKTRPLRRGAAFVAVNSEGAVLLVQRPPRGLLGGMMQPPLGPWSERFPSAEEALKQAPFPAPWKKQLGVVRHGFTHFELEIEAYVAERIQPARCTPEAWVRPERFHEVALPTVMRKILAHALRSRVPVRLKRDQRASAA